MLTSSGDIFEIDTSIRALYAGPDSDLGELRVIYFDRAQASGLQTAIISPGAPFIGRLDALLATRIPSTNQRARILLAPNDLVGNSYLRPVVGQPAVTVRELARIDFIAVLGEFPTVPQERSDRSFRSPAITYGAGGSGFANSTDLQFPIYNRRLVTVTVNAPVALDELVVNIEGVTLTAGGNNNPVPLGTLTFPAILVGASQTFVFRAATDGTFDLMLINFAGSTANEGAKTAAVTIRASDRG